MKHTTTVGWLIAFAFTVVFAAGMAVGQDIRPVTESREVVLDKLYPKAGRLELGLELGSLLNQSYVDTTLYKASLRYFLSETWGVNLMFASASNKDKFERACIESFYNDPQASVDAQCMSQDDGAGLSQDEDANLGPAYVPIREINRMVVAEAVYGVMYGKQIYFLGAVNHFDILLKFGAGLTQSRYYEERTHVKGEPSTPSRGAFSEEEGANNPGTDTDPGPDGTRRYGPEGRPDPRQETNLTTSLALAQKFYLARRVSFDVELANYTLFGTAQQFEPYLVISAGIGVRF
jgi:outer membrane beta-barrel protein